MAGCFIYIFGAFRVAAETKRYTQENEKSDIYIKSPLYEQPR